MTKYNFITTISWKFLKNLFSESRLIVLLHEIFLHGECELLNPDTYFLNNLHRTYQHKNFS